MAKRQDQQQQILTFKDVFKQNEEEDEYLEEEAEQVTPEVLFPLPGNFSTTNSH
jgi:hypothetical protein